MSTESACLADLERSDITGPTMHTKLHDITKEMVDSIGGLSEVVTRIVRARRNIEGPKIPLPANEFEHYKAEYEYMKTTFDMLKTQIERVDFVLTCSLDKL